MATGLYEISGEEIKIRRRFRPVFHKNVLTNLKRYAIMLPYNALTIFTGGNMDGDTDGDTCHSTVIHIV